MPTRPRATPAHGAKVERASPPVIKVLPQADPSRCVTTAPPAPITRLPLPSSSGIAVPAVIGPAGRHQATHERTNSCKAWPRLGPSPIRGEASEAGRGLSARHYRFAPVGHRFCVAGDGDPGPGGPSGTGSTRDPGSPPRDPIPHDPGPRRQSGTGVPARYQCPAGGRSFTLCDAGTTGFTATPAARPYPPTADHRRVAVNCPRARTCDAPARRRPNRRPLPQG